VPQNIAAAMAVAMSISRMVVSARDIDQPLLSTRQDL
jgi:hypothetical protein